MATVSTLKAKLNEAIVNNDKDAFVRELQTTHNLSNQLSDLYHLFRDQQPQLVIRFTLALLQVEPELAQVKPWQTRLATSLILDQSHVFRVWVQLSQKEKCLLRDFLKQVPPTPRLQPWISLTATLPPKERIRAAPKPCGNLIYVVDDSRIIQSMLSRLLKQFDMITKVFSQASEAQEALKSELPCLIFTDLNMPGLSGLQMTQEIRKQHASAALPIVLVTAPEEVSGGDEITRAGIDRVIPKPFNKELVGDVLIQFGLLDEANL